jgi:hypothetical protein
MTTTTVKRRPRGRVQAPDRCACTPDGRMCLAHYDTLDPGRQAGARRRAGVHEPYIGSRR